MEYPLFVWVIIVAGCTSLILLWIETIKHNIRYKKRWKDNEE